MLATTPLGGSKRDVTVHGFQVTTGEEGAAGSPRTTAAPEAVLALSGCKTFPGSAAQDIVYVSGWIVVMSEEANFHL